MLSVHQAGEFKSRRCLENDRANRARTTRPSVRYLSRALCGLGVAVAIAFPPAIPRPTLQGKAAGVICFQSPDFRTNYSASFLVHHFRSCALDGGIAQQELLGIAHQPFYVKQ